MHFSQTQNKMHEHKRRQAKTTRKQYIQCNNYHHNGIKREIQALHLPMSAQVTLLMAWCPTHNSLNKELSYKFLLMLTALVKMVMNILSSCRIKTSVLLLSYQIKVTLQKQEAVKCVYIYQFLFLFETVLILYGEQVNRKYHLLQGNILHPVTFFLHEVVCYNFSNYIRLCNTHMP